MSRLVEYLKQSKISYKAGKMLRSGNGFERISAFFAMPFILASIPYWAKKDRKVIETMEKSDHIFRLRRYDTVCRDGVYMFLPLLKSSGESDLLQKGIFFKEDFHEIEFLRTVKDKYLKPGMVIADIGANIGNHSVYFSKICKAKKIYSFEPIKSTFEMLCKNIEINHLKDIVFPNNYAVGEGQGKAQIASYDPINIGATHLSLLDDRDGSNKNIVADSGTGDLEGRGVFPVISLDDFLIQDTIDFVKIDVEGFEVNVIKGMKKILRKDKPILWIEIFEDNYKEMTALLNKLGYCMTEQLDEADYIFEYKNS